MTENYIYLFLGIILGIGLCLYFFAIIEEKRQKQIKLDQKIFSTPKLDNTMKLVVEKIKIKINEVERELTDDEKNEIIIQCYKKTFST